MVGRDLLQAAPARAPSSPAPWEIKCNFPDNTLRVGYWTGSSRPMLGITATSPFTFTGNSTQDGAIGFEYVSSRLLSLLARVDSVQEYSNVITVNYSVQIALTSLKQLVNWHWGSYWSWSKTRHQLGCSNIRRHNHVNMHFQKHSKDLMFLKNSIWSKAQRASAALNVTKKTIFSSPKSLQVAFAS